MSVTPLVVPICCTNNPVSSDPVFPSLSRMRVFSVTSSLWIVPREIACGSFLPVLQKACVSGTLCASVFCSPVASPARPRLWCRSTKKNRGFACNSNVPWSSHPPLLSFSPRCHPLPLPPTPPPPSLTLSLSHSLSEVSSLYWMVQKQNHKPISVTLAMRLDGPNLSPSGAIGSTPVSLKRPLSCGERGSFLFGDNCN